jgi:glycosyltransferase involved in cell wall biosynthesis
MGPPLVSVVISVRDGERFLPEAVRSVLGQTLESLELLVVDDASTDQTAAQLGALRDPRVRVLRHSTQRGPFASANLALSLARGQFIARLDADDVCAPERLARQVAEFERRPQVQVLGSACRRIDAHGNELGFQKVPRGSDVLLRCVLQPPFVHSSVMWRACANLAYASDLLVGGDYELWGRALLKLEADNLEESLVDYREWPGSLSAVRRAAQEAMHDAVSWRFLAARWPELSGTLESHRALRRWAARAVEQEPAPRDVKALVEALVAASGGREDTLFAPLGTLGQPRIELRRGEVPSSFTLTEPK